mgnify:CR=1 FL=1
MGDGCDASKCLKNSSLGLGLVFADEQIGEPQLESMDARLAGEGPRCNHWLDEYGVHAEAVTADHVRQQPIADHADLCVRDIHRIGGLDQLAARRLPREVNVGQVDRIGDRADSSFADVVAHQPQGLDVLAHLLEPAGQFVRDFAVAEGDESFVHIENQAAQPTIANHLRR